MMRIAVFSDLHLEDNQWSPPALDTAVDAVVLAGDIAPGLDGVQWAERNFSSPVIYVPGNHEYYGWDAEQLTTRFAESQSKTVTVLDRSCLEVGEGEHSVRFLGCTLWTDFRAAEAHGTTQTQAMQEVARKMHDVDQIMLGGRPLTSSDVAAWHARDLDWLGRRLSEPFTGTTVVVTHHAPSPTSRHPAYPPDAILAYFLSDLRDLIRTHAPDLWIHGHTHHCVDHVLGRTRILSNQLGRPKRTSAQKDAYLADARPFNPGLVIEVG
ncbi:metallophosphoesterase [Actinomadura sp. 6N118]|uniref:metallophosphoesterase n=1 Tax=Actinomadura sp. 6N118 TaxID=3375151 RepID=UPI00379C4ADA